MNNKHEGAKKKFNLVDFAIIAILVILIAAFVIKLTAASDAAEEEAAIDEEIVLYEDSPHMRCTVECHNVPVAAAEVMLRNEDPQINNSYKDLAAYIVDVTSHPTVYEVTDAEGNISTVEDPETCTVTFVIEGYYNEAEATAALASTIGTQELRIGKGYTLKTKSIEVIGTVIAMEVVNE